MYNDNKFIKPLSMKESEKMLEVYRNNSFKCKCGHTVLIPKRIKKRICSYCGVYVFREKKDEFMYRLKELTK